MELNEYTDLIEKLVINGVTINESTWEFLSKNMPLDFIEKHIHDYPFDMIDLAKNENLTIDFVNKYINLFQKDKIIYQLSHKISIDIESIKIDPHVKLSEFTFEHDISFAYLSFIKCCKKDGLCEFYQKFYKPYNSKNNPRDCDSCGHDNYIDYCYQMVGRLYTENYFDEKNYALIMYKDILYLVSKKFVKIAINILRTQNIKQEIHEYSFGDENFMHFLSENKGISFQEKFDTKDIYDWEWSKVKVNREQYILIHDLLKQEDRRGDILYEFDTTFLDNIVNKNIDISIFFEKITEDIDIDLNVLNTYDKRIDLFKLLIDVKSREIEVNNYLLDYIPIDFILDNINYDWKWGIFCKRKNISLPIVKKIYKVVSERNKHEYYRHTLDWSEITKLPFVTKELILENPELPWDLVSLINSKESIDLDW